MPGGAHRDDDRGAIDDSRKDEGRQFGVIHDVDRHAPRARGRGDPLVDGALACRGHHRDGVREVSRGERGGDVPELASSGLLLELGMHAGRHHGHAGTGPPEPRHLAHRNLPAAHHHDGAGVEAQEHRQIVHVRGRGAQAGMAAGDTLGCSPHSRDSGCSHHQRPARRLSPG